MATIAWRIILTKTAFAQRDSPNLRKQQRKDIEMKKIHYYENELYIYLVCRLTESRILQSEGEVVEEKQL